MRWCEQPASVFGVAGRTPSSIPKQAIVVAEAGTTRMLASDGAPGLPFENPFLNIQIATNNPLNSKEAITREQALIAFTRTAGDPEFVEDRLGTLEPGKVADLNILSQDIFKVGAVELPQTESLLTIVGGKIAYSHDPFQ